jgi:hypothetical protein
MERNGAGHKIPFGQPSCTVCLPALAVRRPINDPHSRKGWCEEYDMAAAEESSQDYTALIR